MHHFQKWTGQNLVLIHNQLREEENIAMKFSRLVGSSVFSPLMVVTGLVATAVSPVHAQDMNAQCLSLATAGLKGVGRITEASLVTRGAVQMAPPAPVGATSPAPAHCLVRGKINERTGIDGKPYAIGYEVRLPLNWNGKFVFQGGGGVDGVLRPALGLQGAGVPLPNAISHGYASASTDAGHLEEPGPLGPYLFGLDPQARADKGYNSIPKTNAAARAIMRHVYGKSPERAYFVGCSNGGRQAMAATQRYPHMFDGVVAGAPAYRVPLAAIDGMGHTRAFLKVAPKDEQGRPDLGSSFSMAELGLIATAINDKCDGADGLKDGMVNAVKACTFDPAVLTCKPGQNSACLPAEKVTALKQVYDGTRDSRGKIIYSSWPYDPGLAHPGWTAWKIGSPKVWPLNARNITLIPGSLAYDFSVPPQKPTDMLAYTLGFDFDKDTAKVMKGDGVFESGMEFEAATSTNLTKFKDRGGKMILYHGMSDPIFSATDTMAYQDQLNARYGKEAASFSRLFLVPGMGHCAGGPATDQFDVLTALDTWVEKGEAPKTIIATARTQPGVPWPGRTRPLCAYPSVATYKGSGDTEVAASFECR
jgi:pimeloyl-ACP methyl ester carboxylesterase